MLGQARATAHAAGVSVKVAASEFRFKRSTKTVKVGKVIFKITNRGTIQHDFNIDGVKSKLIAPHRRTSITVNFKKKGSSVCMRTVPGYAAAGMKGKRKVI